MTMTKTLLRLVMSASAYIAVALSAFSPVWAQTPVVPISTDPDPITMTGVSCVGNGGLVTIANGSFQLQIVDGAGNPAVLGTGTGVQVTTSTLSEPITSGTFASISIPNPAKTTLSPYFLHLTVVDKGTNKVSNYPKVQVMLNDVPVSGRFTQFNFCKANTTLASGATPVTYVTGPPGPAGPTGSAGPAGSVGQAGSTGPAGSTGAAGPNCDISSPPGECDLPELLKVSDGIDSQDSFFGIELPNDVSNGAQMFAIACTITVSGVVQAEVCSLPLSSAAWIGITAGGASDTTAGATLIATSGNVSANFDGSATAGHCAVLSTISNIFSLHDSGATCIGTQVGIITQGCTGFFDNPFCQGSVLFAGKGSGNTTPAAQYNLSYYCGVGSSNQLCGDAGITTDGSGNAGVKSISIGTSAQPTKITVTSSTISTLPGNSGCSAFATGISAPVGYCTPIAGQEMQVGDGSSLVDCGTGGGAFVHWCFYNGTSWTSANPSYLTSLPTSALMQITGPSGTCFGQQYTVASAVTQYQTVVIGASGVSPSGTDGGPILGVAQATAASGLVSVCLVGPSNILVDATATAGDLAIQSTTVGGDARDSAQTSSNNIGTQVADIGRILTGCTGAGCTALVNLRGPYMAGRQYPAYSGGDCASSAGSLSLSCAQSLATVTDASPIAWALGSHTQSNAKVTLAHTTGTRALNLSGLVTGAYFTLEVWQDSTGGVYMTGGTGCTWYVGGTNGYSASTTLVSSTNVAAASGFNTVVGYYDGTNCVVNVR